MPRESKQADTCEQLCHRYRRFDELVLELRTVIREFTAESMRIQDELVAGTPSAEILSESNAFLEAARFNETGLIQVTIEAELDDEET